MILTIQQKHVLENIKIFMQSNAQIFILRGYAGTGKTTMVKQIADFINTERKVYLMAPTGRAARVLTQKTGYDATTIHRGIYEKECSISKKVNDIAERRLNICFHIKDTHQEKSAVIVDEASMLSSKTSLNEIFLFGTNNLMDDLLTFARPSFGGKLIFVGDPAQLPPVGQAESCALNPQFFKEKGLKVMTAELTEVLRQTEDSVIFKNAMTIRNLLTQSRRNHLVFEEKPNDVEMLKPEQILPQYYTLRQVNNENDQVIICFSNRTANKYNQEIRKHIYNEEQPDLKVGDVLLIVQNNYKLDRMNGEFLKVIHLGHREQISAPVYTQAGSKKERKNIVLDLIHIQIEDENKPKDCLLLLNLLNSDKPCLSVDEQNALYINFCMRHPQLKEDTIEFNQTLKDDPYFNCLKAKYGYAVTGHKCQGGEWKYVFADYTNRTGLSNDCLRWAYTVTTRAQKTLYISNLPHITPFSKFRIEPIQQCSKINPECRILDCKEKSPFHQPEDAEFLHAKCICIIDNLLDTPYTINHVISKPYQEIYYIQTSEGEERYDIRYKKGGIFTKAVPQNPSKDSMLICTMLDDEHALPIKFEYTPKDDIHKILYTLILSACDSLHIQLTNVVDHPEDYSTVYYFRTSGTTSYLKVYVNSQDYITYAKPMSLIGNLDEELSALILEIQNHFE